MPSNLVTRPSLMVQTTISDKLFLTYYLTDRGDDPFPSVELLTPEICLPPPLLTSVVDGRSPGHITYVPDLLQGRRTWGKM